jgi:hypothetical protein
MDFYEVLDQILDLLKQRGRVSYPALKVQFNLDDDHLEAIRAELIEAQQLASDENGRVLIWIGETERAPGSASQLDSTMEQPAAQEEPSPQVEPPPVEPHTLEAETCFYQALSVARRPQAKSLELRVATSLARLWLQQGKRDEARELLSPCTVGSPRDLIQLT